MAYTITPKDMEEWDKELSDQSANSSRGGYQITPEDMAAWDKEYTESQLPAHRRIPGSADPSKLKEALYGFVSGAITEPARGLWNAVSEAANPLGGLANTMTALPATSLIGEYMNLKGVGGPNFQRVPSSQFYQEAGIPSQFSPDVVGQSNTGNISSVLGSLAMGLATPMGRVLSAPSMIKGFLPSLGRGAAEGAVAGAATAPLFMPDTSNLQALATGAGLGAVGGGLVSGIPSAVRSFRKMGGTATPEEIIAAQKDAALAGVQLPAGELLQSPILKQFQSAVLSKTPGSGMAAEYHNIAKQLNDNAIETIDQLTGGYSLNKIQDMISKGLKTGTKEAKIAAKNDYDAVEQLANSTQQKINLSPLYEKLAELAKEHKSVDAIIPGISKVVSKKKLDNLMNKINETGIPEAKSVSFSEARKFDEFLNQVNQDAIREGDRKLGRLATSLKSALNKGIDSSIEQSGNQQLLGAWQKAKNTYVEKLVPYLQKDILNFTQGKKGSSQIIPTFVKSGSWENPEKMRQLTSLLPQELKSPVAALFLTKGKDITEDNIVSILRNYNKMGAQTRQELVEPQIQEKLQAIMNTGKRLGAQKNQMFIPKTGEQSAIKDTVGGWLSLLGTSALAGSKAGPLGSAAAVLGAATLPKQVRKYLMNPKRAQQAINAINKEK